MSNLGRPPAPTFSNVLQDYFEIVYPSSVYSDNYTGGKALTGFEYSWGTDASATNLGGTAVNSYFDAPRALGIMNVKHPGDRYYAKYRCYNSTGNSPWSPISSVLLDAGAYVKYNGKWERAVPYVNYDGKWEIERPFVRYKGFWVEAKS